MYSTKQSFHKSKTVEWYLTTPHLLTLIQPESIPMQSWFGSCLLLGLFYLMKKRSSNIQCSIKQVNRQGVFVLVKSWNSRERSSSKRSISEGRDPIQKLEATFTLLILKTSVFVLLWGIQDSFYKSQQEKTGLWDSGFSPITCSQLTNTSS